MTETTRTTVLVWCQVALSITIMGAIVTTMMLFAFWLNTLRLDMEEDRARARAMLQQHHSALVDHDRARDAATYDQLKLLQAQLDLPMAELVRRALDMLLAAHPLTPVLGDLATMTLPELAHVVQRLERSMAHLAEQPLTPRKED